MKYSEAIKKQELTSKQSSIVASNSYPNISEPVPAPVRQRFWFVKLLVFWKITKV